MKTSIYSVLIFTSILYFSSCKKEAVKTDAKKQFKSAIKYAKGFDIIENNGEKVLIIKAAYQSELKTSFEYNIISEASLKKHDTTLIANSDAYISTPVKRMVVTSTTHIPMIEMLGKETSIIGFPHTRYVSSVKIRKLIDTKKIQEIGQKGALNTEILLDLQPDLIVGYSIDSADKTLNILKKGGIKVIYNGDWLEQTPLGRAEWIKFFGVLYNKEKLADSIFKIIETNYLEAKKIALKSKLKPTILSGAIMSKDIWNLPAGESFVAQFLKDANTNYLWKKTKGKGSLSLSFESVFDKGEPADFWIAPGYFATKDQMLKSNELFSEFKAFKNDNIYTPSTKKGETGGVIYYELAPTRPDLVLKDIIKITNPTLLPNYKLAFFEKMK